MSFARPALTAPHLPTRHACLLAALPQPLLRFDAYSLHGRVAPDAGIATWDNAGSVPMRMSAVNQGTSVPTLRYEDGMPYVELNRSADTRWSYFTSNTSLYMPASPTGATAGFTAVGVARLWPVVDSADRGCPFEKLLMCAEAGGNNVISLGRFSSQATIDLEWQNGPG